MLAANLARSGRLSAGVHRLKPLSICRMLSCSRSFQPPSHGLVSRTVSITQRREYFPWAALAPTVTVFAYKPIIELYGRLKEHWRRTYRGVDADLPSPCQHTVLERPNVMRKINEHIQTLKKERAAVRGSWPVVLFLCGPPGIGKTQIAIEIVKTYQNSVRAIGWIDASSEVTTLRSLRTTGMKLNEDALVKLERKYSGRTVDNSREAKLSDLQRFTQRELKRRRDWLLVVDSVTPESPQIDYLPLHGGSDDKNWGSGIVVVTTRKNTLPQNKFTSVFCDCQMSSNEAGQLLQLLGGVSESNLGGMDDLVAMLCGNSWSVVR